MKTRGLISIFVLILAMLACNFPSEGQNTPAVTEPSFFPTQPSPTQHPSLPSQTPPPTITSTPTLTLTPTVPVASPLDKGVNCRFGPGTEWLVVGFLLVGENATIQGRNSDNSWWYVKTPNAPNDPCWVAASVTKVAGNLGGLPIIPSPQASVIAVRVNVVPDTRSVAGCVGPLQPVSIQGTIETNGPATVKWYFETQQSGQMSTQTTEFDSADEKDVSADYTPVTAAGTYWVRLIVTSPNSKTAEAKYKIECP